MRAPYAPRQGQHLAFIYTPTPPGHRSRPIVTDGEQQALHTRAGDRNLERYATAGA